MDLEASSEPSAADAVFACAVFAELLTSLGMDLGVQALGSGSRGCSCSVSLSSGGLEWLRPPTHPSDTSDLPWTAPEWFSSLLSGSELLLASCSLLIPRLPTSREAGLS